MVILCSLGCKSGEKIKSEYIFCFNICNMGFKDDFFNGIEEIKSDIRLKSEKFTALFLIFRLFFFYSIIIYPPVIKGISRKKTTPLIKKFLHVLLFLFQFSNQTPVEKVTY